MTYPATVRSLVDPAAVTKVTRLFNNTIADVLAELIQNARRAGATAVHLRTTEAENGVQLSVADDGTGIADPSVVLSLGRSGWGEQVARREDPAGMGVFSLAGRHVFIMSRVIGSDTGWRIEVAPQAWEDGSPIAVSLHDRPVGTEIVLLLDRAWAEALRAAAPNTARHCPIPVFLNGEALKRQDWLEGACAVYREGGVRIGIFDDRRANIHSHTINFHGVTVPGRFPTISETHAQWCARVDIVDAPDLQLVLPARKEMVENAALAHLRTDVRRAIYRHIATRSTHRLDHEHWREAAKLGIALSEADQLLSQWVPARSDIRVGITRAEMPVSKQVLIVHSSVPAIEQSAHFALSDDGRFEGLLAAPDPTMIGYSWYDALGHITDMSFEIERHGEPIRYDHEAVPDVESGPVESAILLLTIENAMGRTTVVVPAPVVIVYDDTVCWSVEEAIVLLASLEAVSADDIVDLLKGICFSASEDRDADSWDTQHDRFLLDAREFVVGVLEGDDAAVLERLRAVLANRVQWFVPVDRQFRATIGRDGLELSIEPAPAKAA